MLHQDGIGSFYKGLSMALVGTIASFGSYFFCYRLLKNVVMSKLNLREHQLGSAKIMLITALAGSASSIFSNPFWFLNTRMTLAKKNQQKKSIFQLIKQILNEEGIEAFYKGVLANIILVLNPMINFVIYEAVKRVLTKKGDKGVSAWKIFIASSLGKLMATLATFPILTVRVKM